MPNPTIQALETKRNEQIETAWKAHLERCAKTQAALDAAAKAHAKVFEPSLTRYNTEYSTAWVKFTEEVDKLRGDSVDS